MISAEFIREALTRLLKKTEPGATITPPIYWGADKADERRVRDDAQTGRLHLRAAHRSAAKGLASLDQGENDVARTYLDAAKDFYIAALESRLTPSDWAILGTGAGKRGRPKKAEKQPVSARKRGRPKKINT